MTDPTLSSEVASPPAEPLTMPADGLPPLVDTAAGLSAAMATLRAGEGPVAVDAERAHGFRYSQRAYLLQLRRAGAGTHLVDPVAFGSPADLSELGAAIRGQEWVLHAASQDLPCLYEVGLVPERLFDTELAARLLNYPRVALGTMLEELFGVRLLKEHSAADWSTRPVPPEWLVYAALDVELLIELRDALAAQLVEAGKLEWASQEFAALVAGAGTVPGPRADPWRRTSGIHKVRTRRGMAYVAALWTARDAIARELDRAPGRILPDVAISALAAQPQPDAAALRRIPAFLRRQVRRYEATWVAAIQQVRRLSDADLPPLYLVSDGPPQARLWAAKDPVAAARLARAKEAVGVVAAEAMVPVENLLTPDLLRRLAWRPPPVLSPEAVDQALADLGARPWQRARVVHPLVQVL